MDNFASPLGGAPGWLDNAPPPRWSMAGQGHKVSRDRDRDCSDGRDRDRSDSISKDTFDELLLHMRDMIDQLARQHHLDLAAHKGGRVASGRSERAAMEASHRVGVAFSKETCQEWGQIGQMSRQSSPESVTSPVPFMSPGPAPQDMVADERQVVDILNGNAEIGDEAAALDGESDARTRQLTGSAQSGEGEDEPVISMLSYMVRDLWIEAGDIIKNHSSTSLQAPHSLMSSGNLYMGKFVPEVPSWVVKLVARPNDPFRSMWVLASCLFIIYDVIMVPMEISFKGIEYPISMQTFKVLIIVFWTIDIILTFFTGVITKSGTVEMRPSFIAKYYIKRWFLPDVVLVGADWLTYMSSEHHSSPLSVVRWARFVRFMRLLRLYRLSSAPSRLLRQCAIKLQLSEHSLYLMTTSLRSLLNLLLVLHMTACFWHLVGDSTPDGWVRRLDMEDTWDSWRYFFSMLWTMNRLQGLQTVRQLNAGYTELAIESFLVFLSCIVVTFFRSQVNSASMSYTVMYQNTRLKKVADEYAWRHNLPDDLHVRILRFFDASQLGGPQEIVECEHTLVEKLPDQLQHDVLYHSYRPLLCKKQVFKHMYLTNPRALRHVCWDALSVSAAVQGETIFAVGDVCHYMFFLRSGSFEYISEGSRIALDSPEPASLWTSHRLRHMHMLSLDGAAPEDIEAEIEAEIEDIHLEQSSICELVLWTPWEHVGALRATKDSMLVALTVTGFCEVIKQHAVAYGHACLYAKRFIYMLNRYEQPVTDLTAFTFTAEELTTEVFHKTEFHHFMFISHYKVEAGTEATLVRDQIETLIKRDQRHPGHGLRSPVFIDSEDLVDLATLVAHVQRSTWLLLLLTPGLLSRPWCLLEIVTACRKKEVNIVPVEIQRPGMKYQYPDDKFYKEFLQKKHLKRDSIKLLEDEGVHLKEVVEALQKTFKKIALPFSPHRSRTVRDAEINDIMRRCDNRSATKTSMLNAGGSHSDAAILA